MSGFESCSILFRCYKCYSNLYPTPRKFFLYFILRGSCMYICDSMHAISSYIFNYTSTVSYTNVVNFFQGKDWYCQIFHIIMVMTCAGPYAYFCYMTLVWHKQAVWGGIHIRTCVGVLKRYIQKKNPNTLSIFITHCTHNILPGSALCTIVVHWSISICHWQRNLIDTVLQWTLKL